MYNVLFAFLFVTTILWSESSWAQTNLVPNPSFEGNGSSESGSCVIINPGGNYPDSWDQWVTGITSWRMLKKAGLNLLNKSIPTPDRFCTSGSYTPHSGDGVIRLISNVAGASAPHWREFVTAKLSSQLIPGNIYKYSYWVKLRGGVYDSGTFGLAFSEGQLSQRVGSSLYPVLGLHQKVPTQTTIPGDWTNITGIFVPQLAHEWITIGKVVFTLGSSYQVDVDDVELYNLGTYGCPNDDWKIENRSFFEQSITKGKDYVLAGEDVGLPLVSGEVKILNGSEEVVYQAGDYIDLKVGFTAEYGSDFRALIGDCNANPCLALPYTNKQSLDLCGLGSHQISTLFSPSSGVTYKWYPSTFLSQDDIPNPTFVISNLDAGVIKYTVEMTNECGERALEHITVFYSSGGGTQAPTITNVVEDPYKIEFDFIFDSNVREFTISVAEITSTGGLGTVVYTSNHERGIDFTGNSIHEAFDKTSVFSLCRNYYIQATVVFYCPTTLINGDHVVWNGLQPMTLDFVSDIMSANGDGVDDEWFFESTNADSYQAWVRELNGTQIFYSTGPVNSSPLNVWDGIDPLTGQQVPSGVYEGEVIIYGLCPLNSSISETKIISKSP